MKRWFRTAFAVAMTIALLVVLNMGVMAGFPWSEH
jgi:hypothetical protein